MMCYKCYNGASPSNYGRPLVGEGSLRRLPGGGDTCMASLRMSSICQAEEGSACQAEGRACKKPGGCIEHGVCELREWRTGVARVEGPAGWTAATGSLGKHRQRPWKGHCRGSKLLHHHLTSSRLRAALQASQPYCCCRLIF